MLGFEFLSLVCTCVRVLSCSQLFATPWTVPCQALAVHGFPGKNTGVSCHFLLQGIFLTQELNPGLLHCRRPGFNSWVRNWTLVSCIAGRFLMKWATGGALSASWGLFKSEDISWDNLGKKSFSHKYPCGLSNLVTGKEAEVTWVWREDESRLVVVCLFILGCKEIRLGSSG